ncbi:acyltransferase [uncultured Bradyrhizobium sp.]|uniref:acyltransferase n=1 Tax=uncultured Bradyrhizobium sp. TaxID=199684 RepID=UPI0035C97074
MEILGGRYLTEGDLAHRGIKKVGSNVRVHETAILVDLERIEIGSNVRIDPYCVLSAAAGHIRLGNYIHIGSHNVTVGGGGVEFADFVNLSQAVRIYSVNDDYSGESLTSPMIPRHLSHTISGAVRLGRHVIVGSGSVILPRVTIGDGCAIGALSLVNGSLPDWGIYAGVPVRLIRARSRRLLADEAALIETGS